VQLQDASIDSEFASSGLMSEIEIFRQLDKRPTESAPIGLEESAEGLRASVAAVADLRWTSDFPLLEHLAAFSEFCETLLVVYLPTLQAAN
jgi:hypothetical protein